jgi:sulfide:quinone oxidoreductase
VVRSAGWHTEVGCRPPLLQRRSEQGLAESRQIHLQHPDYGNVFGAGDVMGVASNKTGAAVRKEAPILVHNLVATMEGEDPSSFRQYKGYTSCPLITGYGKVVLAEFDYSGKHTPSFPHDSYELRLYGGAFRWVQGALWRRIWRIGP